MFLYFYWFYLACLFYLHLKSTPVLFCTSILLIATYMYKQWRTIGQFWKIESGNVTVFEHLHIPYSNIRILEHSRNDSSQFTLEWAISLLLPVDRNLPTDSEHSLFCVIFWLLSQKFSDRIFDRWTLSQTGGCMAADRKRGNCMALGIGSLKEMRLNSITTYLDGISQPNITLKVHST